jgi:hypothetical protein
MMGASHHSKARNYAGFSFKPSNKAHRQSTKIPRPLQKPLTVIPAKAGIQVFWCLLDPGFRHGDGFL